MIGREMIGHLLLFLLVTQTIEAQDGIGKLPPPTQRKWMTLNGNQPEIVANGGYSGFFPDSSLEAYSFVGDSSIPGTILYCNLHFTKDNDGFCVSEINLMNTTNIQDVDPKGGKVYNINGQEIHGWFGLDYPAEVIFQKVGLRQNLFTRTEVYDGTPIISPSQLVIDRNGQPLKIPPRMWLNIQYDIFYQQNKISPEKFLLEKSNVLPEFISSPEIGFLKSIGPKLGKVQTKIIFEFLAEDVQEPTTKETYGSLVNKLSTIKSFASGILVPKEYIWPMDKARVLQPATNLVQDAHKQGLEVYASGFANDNYLSYNYSYDPTREYLQFIENSQFSIDGFLTDFPSTTSEAIGCIPQNKNASRVIPSKEDETEFFVSQCSILLQLLFDDFFAIFSIALIISHNGASGDFPGATDLAYQKAIEDGADIIDCSVQLSKDGIAFCLDRADLMKTTTAVTLYLDRSTNVPEIQSADGIFSFDLTWSEIQSLSPQIESFYDNDLVRNPGNKNKGKFVTLPEFLELAKTKAVTGVLIFIQNAAYLASNKNLDIVDTVSTALTNASFDKQLTQKVLIQSDDSSVLLKFKNFPNYQRVFYINPSISGAPHQVAQDVKKYADAVFVHRDAIVMASDSFAFNFTNTVPAMHAANISVYVGVLKNEFQNFIMDYLSDPYVELSTMYSQKVDGFVTDYPATANSFVRSSCTSNGSPYVTNPMEPGLLYEPDETEKVAEPPLLSTGDVIDPPLPAVTKNSTAASESPTSTPKSSSPSTIVSKAHCFFAAMVGILTMLIVE
ncbi:glycerophosphodiester phosphodiesterase GDPDL6-like isoform X2 [Primulina eburnea]|uniref:glycerophosphodiester phosphodiesterase GDPDL6-like isoform X2 n=1 Tax=Primulina eburnea TaxID=1245227 RepID=UPI003C6C41CE